VQLGGFESEQLAILTQSGELDLDRLVEDASVSRELAEAVALALEELEQLYPEQKLAAIVQHRVFDGLTQEEIATLIGITGRTVRTRQKLAYGLLRKALQAHFKRE
jgi:RNA polymerase sigma factor (sigma-70 family)